MYLFGKKIHLPIIFGSVFCLVGAVQMDKYQGIFKRERERVWLLLKISINQGLWVLIP